MYPLLGPVPPWNATYAGSPLQTPKPFMIFVSAAICNIKLCNPKEPQLLERIHQW